MKLFVRLATVSVVTVAVSWLHGSLVARQDTVATQPTVTLTTRSVVPTTVTVNTSFTVTATLKVGTATAEHAGITISFPSFTASGVSNGSYNSGQGNVTTTSITNGITPSYQIGSSNCNGTCPGGTPHLLVEGDWSNVSANGTKTVILSVTPKAAGTFKVRMRAWVTTSGYANVTRDPGSGPPADQQGWPVYETTVTVNALPAPSITNRTLDKTSIGINDTVKVTVTGKNTGGSASFGGVTVQVREAFTNGAEVTETHTTEI